jgi:KaiC/GvpD/RAD55 family RecA-like ATPase
MSVENLIFSQLLSNEEYARKVLPHLREEYMSTNEAKIFLKIYHRFFSKYNKPPAKQSMLLEIEKLKASADTYDAMVEFVNHKEEFTESLQYLVDMTEEYCKERALYNALRDSVLIMDGSNTKETRTPEMIPTLLTQALAVCFDTTVGHSYGDDFEERYEYYHDEVARIPTGIPYIDKITRGGFPRKTLNVLLAPPHGGKSFAMVNVGAGALKQGQNVLYITMEMAEMEIGKRFDVNLLDVDFDMLEEIPKDIYLKKMAKLKTSSNGKLVIKEYGTGMASAANFRQLLSELKTKQNFTPDLIIIDYMNICASEFYKAGSNHNSYTVVGSVGKELRALAKDANAAILTATQTNRSGVESSELDMTAVSDSASTSMIADFLLGVINTGELRELNQIMFVQIKNRYDGISSYVKHIMGTMYSKMQMFDLDENVEKFAPKKRDKLNSKKPDSAPVDMSHTIKPTTASFDDFKFEDE